MGAVKHAQVLNIKRDFRCLADFQPGLGRPDGGLSRCGRDGSGRRLGGVTHGNMILLVITGFMVEWRERIKRDFERRLVRKSALKH